jgi:hypothetical protein
MTATRLKQFQAVSRMGFLIILLMPAFVQARGQREIKRGTLFFGAEDAVSDQETLSDRQKVLLVTQLVGALIDDRLFNDELAIKLVLSKAVSNEPGFEAKEFTDLLLNKLSDTGKVLVVNQDLKMDLDIKLDLRLMRYESSELTRHHGQYLGADYLISSRVSARLEQNEKGKWQKIYTGSVSVEGVKSTKVYLTKSIEYKAGKARR